MIAYQADPKTGLVMILVSPTEIDLTLTLLMRGMEPGDLTDPEIKGLLKGWEVVHANNVPTKTKNQK